MLEASTLVGVGVGWGKKKENRLTVGVVW